MRDVDQQPKSRPSIPPKSSARELISVHLVSVNRRPEMAAIDAVLSRPLTVVLVSVAPKPTANLVRYHLWFG